MAESSLQYQSVDPSFASGSSLSPREMRGGDDTIAPQENEATAMDKQETSTLLLVKGDLVRVSEE